MRAVVERMSECMNEHGRDLARRKGGKAGRKFAAHASTIQRPEGQV